MKNAYSPKWPSKRCQLKRNILILLILFTSLLCYSRYSAAAPGCQVTQSVGQISFGNIPSLNMVNKRQTASATDIGLTCGGGLLSILANTDKINAVISTTNNATLKNSNGSSIPYAMYRTSNYENKIAPNSVFNYNNPVILGLLGLGNSNSINIPIYLKIDPATYNLAAGTYTDSITVNWDWDVCAGINALGICLGRSRGKSTWLGNVSLVVQNDCMVNAPDINFGSAPLSSSFNPVTQTITIYCTKGANYSVGLSNGANNSNTQRRLMFNSNYLNYEIYQGSTNKLRWGKSSGERRLSTGADINPGQGSGVSTSMQGFIYQAAILQGQATPPAGVYTDTVILDITF
ncbi:spore coat protein U domain-containing protein [Orbus sturtevantii]|uniref:Csu type fimbrial protein n=1 Tax=Orbus sturtevantii TaxID=3074109 RepID=UPI00370D05D0